MSTLTAPPAQANGRVDVVAGLPVADGAAHLLDLYLPQGRGPWPATVYLHGAARHESSARIDPAHHAERCRGLARRGVAVASAACRPARGSAVSAQVRDAATVVRWVQRHGDRFALTTQVLGAWGAATGAHLAALLGTGTDPTVAAVGVLLAPGPGAPPRPAAPRSALGTGVGSPGRAPARSRHGGPSGRAGPGRVPFLVVRAVPALQLGAPPSLRFRTALVRRGSHGTGVPAPATGRDDPRLGSDVVLATLAAFFKETLA